jgi:speckle-type POZ protein
MVVFNWIRPGYKLVKVNFGWNVQVPFLQGKGQMLESILFSPQETPNSKWKLEVVDRIPAQIEIFVLPFNPSGERINFIEPALVKISIVDRKGQKVLQQMHPSETNYVKFYLFKEEIIKSGGQQVDGSLNFCCKIFTHVKKEPISLSADPSSDAINCLNELSTQFEELFDSMPTSDVNFNIGGRDFPAHKLILATRSKYFAAMFQHPTKENLTNQIVIEDIEPEVFDQLLRFIYTGRVSTATMETMAAALFISADKYLLDQLKRTCENHLLHHMSPANCLELLLCGDLQNPSEPLKEAAKFFRRLPSQVMAAERWENTEEENPRLLCQIHKFLLNKK